MFRDRRDEPLDVRQARERREARDHREALLDDAVALATDFADDPEQLRLYLGDLASNGHIDQQELSAVEELLWLRAPDLADAAFDAPGDQSGASLAAEIVADVRHEHDDEASVVGLPAEEAAWVRREVRRAAEALAVAPGEVTVRADAEAQRRVTEEGAAGLAEGKVIYLDPSQLRSRHRDGRALLGHELAHAGQARERLHAGAVSEATVAASETEARSFAQAFATGSVLWRPTVALPTTHRAADTGRAGKKKGGGLRHAALRYLRRQLPHLAAALTKGQLDQVVRFLEASNRLRQLTQDYDSVPKTIAAEHQARREALDIQIDAARDTQERDDTLVVPATMLVGPDVVGGNDVAVHVAAALDAVYRELLTLPFVVTLRDDEELVTIRWGGLELSHHKGRIERSDLERNAHFGRQLAKGSLADYADEDERERAAGGYSWNAEGMKLGELYGNISDTDLAIGAEIGPQHGIPDDERGLSDVSLLMAGTATATVALRAPDGWLHVFAVAPDFSSDRLRTPNDDGWGYVLDTESEVASQVVRLMASDGITLRWNGDGETKGWRARVSYEEEWYQEVATGAIMGDWYEDPSAGALLGQVFGGFIPGWAEIGVGRDILAGIHKVWKSGGTDGRAQLVMAFSGLIPINKIIDAIKRRGGQKAVNAFLKDEVPALRRRLERAIERDPAAVVQRFHLQRAMQEAAEGIFERTDDDFVRTLTRLFDDAGGMVGAGPVQVIHATGGDWKKLVARINDVGSGAGGVAAADAKAMGEALESWRHGLMTNTLPAKVEQEVAAAGLEGGVTLKRTGSEALLSDCDVSFHGPNAVAHRNIAKRYLEQTLGAGWEKALDGSLLIDATRLNLHLDIGAGLSGSKAALAGRFANKIERNLTREAELNTLVRMIREGRGDTAKALAKKLRVPWKKVKVQANEIEHLAASGGARLKQLELEVDLLHKQFLAPGNSVAKKAALAEEIAVRQGKINVLDPEAYVTSGGVLEEVLRRSGKTSAMMTARRAYMDALDNAAMLQHVQAQLERSGLTPSVAKSLSKYSKRLLCVARVYNPKVKDIEGNLELLMAHNHNLVTAKRHGAAALLRDPDARVLEYMGQLNGVLGQVLETAKTFGPERVRRKFGEPLSQALVLQQGTLLAIISVLKRPLVTAPPPKAAKEGDPKAAHS